MNPHLASLQAYPFERLRALLAGVTPPPAPPIRLSIGEPQHETPEPIRRALIESLGGLSVYPTTAGLDTLREAIAAWFRRRFNLSSLDLTATSSSFTGGTVRISIQYMLCNVPTS